MSIEEKLKVIREIENGKQADISSEIWCSKFYHPNDLEKQQQNFSNFERIDQEYIATS